MSLTTAGGAVTRQLLIPFTLGIWSGSCPGPDRDLRRAESNGMATAAANPENVSTWDMRQVSHRERRAVSH